MNGKKLDYDLIVIGGGGAGLVASKFARGINKSVALIEKYKLGGECTWTGCVPSKALIKAAQVAKELKHLQSYGLNTQAPIQLNTDSLMQHLQTTIKEVYSSHTPETLEKVGIDVIFGDSSFIDANTIAVDGKKLTAKNFIIATGSVPFVPPLQGLDTVPYFTNQNLFSLKELPKSMSILGGGAVGVEMACALNNLGVKISMIEMNEHILSNQDQEVAMMLEESMKKSGIEIRTGLRAEAVAKEGQAIRVECQNKEGKKVSVSNDSLLIAVGRRAAVESLGLDNAGIEYSKKGITTDRTLRTTAKNVYACGDVVGPYLFSHMAYYQSAIAARNALLPFSTKVDYTNIIWVIFADPEFASAGLTEKKAREKYGKGLSIYRYDYKNLDRALTDNTTFGMGKVICYKGKVVGAHILGARAGEIIHEIQLGKTYGIPFTDFYKVIHAYPTYSEVIWHLAKKAYISSLQQNFFVKVILRMYKFFTGNKKG